MLTKVLKNYQSVNKTILTVGVREDVETLAQKISRFSPKHFPSDGFVTYQIALEQIGKERQTVPYIKLIKIISEKFLLKIFTSEERK